ncbi:hypothetical protein [Helicobacter sp. CLO-3]|uniref:hypothetical protein n=1 Tax=Helicobacter sp. CLO-3 TaxID=211 RepID=UPI001561956D|nr:hypothetical protein [Helicobacter sp. CLO-3]
MSLLKTFLVIASESVARARQSILRQILHFDRLLKKLALCFVALLLAMTMTKLKKWQKRWNLKSTRI